ncbi:MAG TPA: response regulator [Phototrophicaceae bacterium]|nr:response regulator [Phototrophicaceae bacterium]
MSSSKVFSGSPVPRQYVFIMTDGAFVVQWDEARVQDLLTGRYRPFSRDHFGHPITDYELSQLKAAGRVEHYNRSYVWLYALPEGKRFDVELKTIQRMRDRVRTYYLNTTLPKSQLGNIEALLVALGLDQELSARERSHLVAILAKDGAPFLHFSEVEGVQRQLMLRAPEIFRDSVVAFIEGNRTEFQSGLEQEQTVEPNDLETVIASQTDTTLTQGKCVVVAGSHDEDQFPIVELCQEMGMAVQATQTAGQALQLLEDLVPDLFIMDLQLTDMHGWEMLAKAREISSLRNLPVIVIADQSAAPNQQSFALTVAKVDVYLVKPVSSAKLRQNIWMVLKQHAR